MTTTTSVVDYTLDDDEIALLASSLEKLATTGGSPLDPAFYDAHWNSHELLPAGLRRFLENFRRHEPAAACLVHGFPVDDAAVGPTPEHWDRPTAGRTTLESDLFMALCALALGEPFCWSTLQRGRMIQDVFPIRGDEQRLNGHGSEAFLVFHTDDAFHADTCDYLMLFGVRNPDAVPTYVSSVREIELAPEDRATLSDQRYRIVPDEEHIRQLAERAPDHPSLRRAETLRDEPTPVPLLFGAQSSPYLRLDGPYTHLAHGDDAAGRALDALHLALDRAHRAVVVGRGTLLVLDNKVAAHAREAFTARYDGTDRWLRKIIVSRGLRKWADCKVEAGGRRII